MIIDHRIEEPSAMLLLLCTMILTSNVVGAHYVFLSGFWRQVWDS
jgi:hypothetical protein